MITIGEGLLERLSDAADLEWPIRIATLLPDEASHLAHGCDYKARTVADTLLGLASDIRIAGLSYSKFLSLLIHLQVSRSPGDARLEYERGLWRLSRSDSDARWARVCRVVEAVIRAGEKSATDALPEKGRATELVILGARL